MTDHARDAAAGPHGFGGDLRAQLEAAGAIVGTPILVTDGADWELTPRGLRVGLGHFTALGHSDAEAVALSLLEVWQHVRFPRVSPERDRRRAALSTGRPELAPLLETVTRLQAAAELLTVVPAAQDPLAAAASRSLPATLLEWPRHLQWIGILLHIGLLRRVDGDPGTALDGVVDPAVAEEWRQLQRRGGTGPDPVRRVTAPDPTRSALLRWERAVALLLPAFERLRAQDVAERGLGVGDRAHRADDGSSDPAPDDLTGTGPGGDPDAAESDAGRSTEDASETDAAATPPDPAADRARAGDGAEHAEGADLFAAEQAGFVRAFLSTPMPAAGALVLDAGDLPQDARATGDSAASDRAGGTGAGTRAGAGAALDYRRRAEELSDAIGRMREVWSRVIAERVAERRVPGRRARDEGDTLRLESLASAVADAIAGVPRPSAFVQRESRARRTRRAGSTDYVLLVDRSASMQGPVAEAAADAALIMVEALAGAERDIRHAEDRHGVDLELSIRTALIVFDAQALIVKPLSRGLDDDVRQHLVHAIRSPRGSTNDGAALGAAARQLGLGTGAGDEANASPRDGLERRRLVIFVGDGGSNDPVAAARELRRLHEAGVEVIGVGIGSDEVVERFAPTSRRVDDPRRLPEVLREIVAEDVAERRSPRIPLQHEPHDRV